jgi:hypothetical protein
MSIHAHRPRIDTHLIIERKMIETPAATVILRAALISDAII